LILACPRFIEPISNKRPESHIEKALIPYDLAGAESARRLSPYCWRIRLALEDKGLPVETVPWRFTDKDVIAFSGQGRVPVLVDSGKAVVGSWEIESSRTD
jgi:hypothetical protein